MNLLKAPQALLKTMLKPLDDKRVSVPLAILLVLYSSLIAPEPPKILVDTMKNPLARIVALCLLALIMAKGNLPLAMLSTVAVVLTLTVAHKTQVVYTVVNTAKNVADRVLDVAEDAVDSVGDVIFGDQPTNPVVNELQQLEGV